MIYKIFLKRVMAITLALLITILPLTYVSANTAYTAYEFVVDSNNDISVNAGDEIVITVTVNGPLSNARMVSYQLEYLDEEFFVADDEYDALDSDWFDYVGLSGKGLGGIAFPGVGTQPHETEDGKSVFSVSFVGTNKYAYISENKDIYGANTAVAGKIKFTAKKYIEDVSTSFILTNAENEYGDTNGKLGETCNGIIVQLSETLKVTKAINAINAIGSPITYSSKTKIEDARAAYDAVLEKLKDDVENYTTLTAAEASLKLIQSEIDAVADKIEAIGEVTLDDEVDISAARSAYTALAKKDSDAAESLKNYGTDNVNYLKLLEAAETKLIELKQEAEDKAAAQIVINKINALDKTITLEDEASIKEARAEFGALTDAQQKLVTNIAVLVTAESQLSTLKSYKEIAEQLVLDIAKIPHGNNINRDNVDDVQKQIYSATETYNKIGGGLQTLVTNWYLVGEAQTRVTELKTNIATADAFVDKVETICSKVDLGSGESITAALAEYDGFNDEIKGFVAEAKADLDKAKTRYDNMVWAKDLIDALPAVADVTPACGEDLEAAEGEYNALSDDDKATVDTATSSKLAAVRKALDESVVDVKAAIDVINKIIGAEITLESSKDITDALTAYSSLTEAEKKYLEDYNGYNYGKELNSAYEEYLGLVEGKEAEDKFKAGLVISQINSLGNITLDSGADIAAAEEAYKALSDDQKAIVNEDNYSKLVEARKTYDELVEDNKAVQVVINAINNIGTVTYSNECNEEILAAESAYIALVEADKISGKNLASQITNYLVMTTAREDYGILENIVILIGGIGEAENTDEHLAKLNAAQAAYDALDDEDKPKTYLKAQLTEQKAALDAAWEAYNLLLVKYVQLDMLMSDGTTTKNLVVVTNMPEGQMVALDEYTVSVMKFGETIYNMIVTESKLSEEALSGLSLVDAAVEPYMLGDVDDSRTVTATDALIANKYAARVSEALKIFADDAMAFVRADVNRSGTVSGLDALMIAQKAVNNELFEDDPFADAQFEACIKKAE